MYFRTVKRLAAILMILLFGVSSSGATIQLHYCCGKLKSISFGSVQAADCGMDMEMESGPCCETQSLSSGTQDQEHQYFSITPGSAAPAEALPAYTGIRHRVVSENVYHETAITGTPPPRTDILVKHCVFRI